jgi:hypothetical protein
MAIMFKNGSCLFRWIIAAAMFLTAAAAEAHHGFGTIDAERDIEISGVITGLDFVNPHSWLYVDVTGESGAVTPFRCEMRPASGLRRAGWTPEMFVIGDTILIQGAPDREDPNACFVATLTFADGTKLDRYGQRIEPSSTDSARARPARLPTGEPNISGDWVPEQFVMTDPSGLRGAFVPIRLAEEVEDGEVPEGWWSLRGVRGDGPLTYVWKFLRVALRADRILGSATREYFARDVQYSDLAYEARRQSDAGRCNSVDVVVDWWIHDQSNVNRITQSDDSITLEYGHLGTTRTIHMSLDNHPEDVAQTDEGHSIGRWENDVLIVDTVGFRTDPRVPRSAGQHVVERFWLDEEGPALHREFVLEDPEYIVGEGTGLDTLYLSATPFFADSCKE